MKIRHDKIKRYKINLFAIRNKHKTCFKACNKTFIRLKQYNSGKDYKHAISNLTDNNLVPYSQIDGVSIIVSKQLPTAGTIKFL